MEEKLDITVNFGKKVPDIDPNVAHHPISKCSECSKQVKCTNCRWRCNCGNQFPSLTSYKKHLLYARKAENLKAMLEMAGIIDNDDKSTPNIRSLELIDDPNIPHFPCVRCSECAILPVKCAKCRWKCNCGKQWANIKSYKRHLKYFEKLEEKKVETVELDSIESCSDELEPEEVKIEKGTVNKAIECPRTQQFFGGWHQNQYREMEPLQNTEKDNREDEGDCTNDVLIWDNLPSLVAYSAQVNQSFYVNSFDYSRKINNYLLQRLTTH